MSHLTSPQVLFAKSLNKVINLVPRNIDKEGGRAKDSPVITSGLQVLFTSSLWQEGFPAVTCVQCGLCSVWSASPDGTAFLPGSRSLGCRCPVLRMRDDSKPRLLVSSHSELLFEKGQNYELPPT